MFNSFCKCEALCFSDALALDWIVDSVRKAKKIPIAIENSLWKPIDIIIIHVDTPTIADLPIAIYFDIG